MMDAPAVKCYQPQEPLTVQCDASEKGLGVALFQEQWLFMPADPI